jgi:MFS family permease
MPALRALRRSIFLVALPFGMLTFVLPIYGLEIGASAVQIGLFFTAFSLVLVVLRPLVGAGLDRFGRRPFLIAGLAGYALTMLIFALSRSVAAIVAARAVQGVASSLLWLSAYAIIADSAERDERGQAFGRVTMSAGQGGIVGTFVGMGVVIELGITRGWPPLFAAFSAAAAVSAVLALFSLSESRRPSAKRETLPIRWTRPWALLLLVTLVTGAAWAMISPVLMIYLQEKLNAHVADLALAFLPAALVAATLPARLGRLTDRFGRKPLMLVGLAGAAITSLLIPVVPDLIGLALLWAFQAACYAAGDPAEQALVADLTGGDQRGRAYGMYAAASDLGMALGPLAGGWLYQQAGPGAPFIANAVMLALCALILVVWLKVPEPAEAEAAA